MILTFNDWVIFELLLILRKLLELVVLIRIVGVSRHFIVYESFSLKEVFFPLPTFGCTTRGLICLIFRISFLLFNLLILQGVLLWLSLGHLLWGFDSYFEFCNKAQNLQFESINTI